MIAVRSRAHQLYDAAAAVVGQEKPKRLLSVLLARQWDVRDGLLDRSGGAVIGGRSGSGKTYLARMMCKASGLPFAEVNATRYTEAGYAGLDLNKMFIPLFEEVAAQREPEDVPNVLKRSDIKEIVAEAGCGVILLDEFDKWMLRQNHVTGQKDTAIQADLLKMIEGCQEYVSDSEDEIGVLFDTTRVLILCAGAFVNLQGIVAKRLMMSRSEDGSFPLELWDNITQEDFVAYGVLPELAGRLATHIFLRPLTTANLRDILLSEGGIVEEYRKRFEAAGCEWAVSREGIQHVAEQAIKRDTGARAVDHIMWKVFGEALFAASTSESPCHVNYEPMWAQARVT